MNTETAVRLTAFTSTGGCAAKYAPVDLHRMLRWVRQAGIDDASVLVGLDTADDAGVYKISDTIALVQTADFIGPLCDDGYTFGQISAANAISDVYAMGGRPLTALNLCCFPASGIPDEQIAAILTGALDKISESGARLLGGHTVADPQVKFGLSVTGIVHPDKVVTNAGARPGDLLVLGKPLGVGVMVSAARSDQISAEAFAPALEAMKMLNKGACDAMLECGAHACTDVTGFGLAGHALGMARASKAGLRFRMAALPRHQTAIELFASGLRTALSHSNRKLSSESLTLEGAIPAEEEALIYDPQTSGGLLISVPEESATKLVAQLSSRGYSSAAIVGEVFSSSEPCIEVVAA